jgi:hypothetical protein
VFIFSELKEKTMSEQAPVEQDWEAILAQEGLGADLPADEAVAVGDALEAGDPTAAAERAEQVMIEEQGDRLYGGQ